MQSNPSSPFQPRVDKGFSALEALVCAAILAILISLAAIPFRAALEQHRIASVRTELIAAIQWARWEALRRNDTVTLMRRTDCSTHLRDADAWHCGWHVVAGQQITKKSVVEDAEVLQTFGVPSGLRLVHQGGGPLLQFAGSGYPVLVAHKFIVGLPADTPVGVVTARHTATLCMNRTGRVRAIEGQTTC